MTTVHKYTDLMVDTETTGFIAGVNGIIALAAIPFDLRNSTIGEEQFYSACNPFSLDIDGESVYSWDPKTLQFHIDHETNLVDEDNYELLNRDNNIQDEMIKFVDFVQNNCVEGVKFWAKPSHFDYPFVNHTLKTLALLPDWLDESGWNEDLLYYRNVRDVNTYVSEVVGFDASKVTFAGVRHYAPDDALHQIQMLFAANSMRDIVAVDGQHSNKPAGEGPGTGAAFIENMNQV